jgi:hypothetical protein
VGIDYPSYIEIFNYEEFTKEPGRTFMISLVKGIYGTGQLYIFVMAVITEFFAYKTLIRYEKNNFWFLTIIYYCVSLFYIASFNGSRQYMAIAVMLWSLHYVENSFLKYMTISLIAGFAFHFSALVFIPLYFFLKHSFSKKYLIIILICVIFANQMLIELLNYTPYAKYLVYMDNDGRENKVQFTQYILLIISFFLVLFGDIFKKFGNNIVLYNMNVLCLYTLTLVILQDIPSFIGLFQRFNNYFVYSYLLIIPAVLSSMKKHTAALSKILLVIFSIGYLILTVVVKGEHHMIVPYDMNFILFHI